MFIFNSTFFAKNPISISNNLWEFHNFSDKFIFKNYLSVLKKYVLLKLCLNSKNYKNHLSVKGISAHQLLKPYLELFRIPIYRKLRSILSDPFKIRRKHFQITFQNFMIFFKAQNIIPHLWVLLEYKKRLKILKASSSAWTVYWNEKVENQITILCW